VFLASVSLTCHIFYLRFVPALCAYCWYSLFIFDGVFHSAL